jgi:hypothetical protein
MFTWEEAGLLRSMLLVLKWTVIAVLLLSGAYFRRPLLSAASAAYHSVDARVHGRLVTGDPPATDVPR